MNVEFDNDLGENPGLREIVKSDSDLKEWLVDYVGKQHDPTSGDVTVEMIIETIANEFPEFLMVVAEENWMRGYHQALTDVEVGQTLFEKENELKNGP